MSSNYPTRKPIKDNVLVGVIGGTVFDTQMGMGFLNSKNIPALASSISDNPFDQTLLQLSAASLTDHVKQKIIELIQQGCNSIFIYCNSLSGSIHLEQLRSCFQIPVFTPLEAYSQISSHYNTMGLMAANCQALGHIEKIILKENPQAIVSGWSSLFIVNAIEKGLSPEDIIINFDLLPYCQSLRKQQIDVLLLGCTHFSYFVNALSDKLEEEAISLKLFDPSETMFGFLMSYLDLL